ncbi:hypothetical protein [Lysinibacillus capsici]|uniref:hypothetical protein n=1 Tax=Lysinibacillus capsici TaxID=2115968 RepID=UPI00325FA9C4
MLEKVNNLQQQIDMLTGENIGELLERLNDSIQQALTAAQEARTAKTATEEATALAAAATELAKASALLAEEKANYANEKAVLAQETADNANLEASDLSQLKIDVVQATQDASTATDKANQATKAAQTATDAINVVLPNVEGLVNLKEWNTETQYKKNNFVTLEGNGYMALRDNKGVKPPSFPVLSNADWAMFVQKGEKGEQGTGVRILGTLPDESALPPLGEPGDAYLINGDLYVWSDTTNDWTNVGTIKGLKGDRSIQTAINKLKKYIKGTSKIRILPGDYSSEGQIKVEGFYGQGRLVITAYDGLVDVQNTNNSNLYRIDSLYINNCRNGIDIFSLKSTYKGSDRAGFYTINSSFVFFGWCSDTVINSDKIGFLFEVGSTGTSSGCICENKEVALEVRCSVVSSMSWSVGNGTNVIGLKVIQGGVIGKSYVQPIAAIMEVIDSGGVVR